ncbi:uncharacterized protein LOC135467456 [Liolophura sinensis]|uniref:uncharacterized protein LOC135467456 n=1 Tax=Liolophura sinensis TaxID=3198878 RepID=UPI0031590991
MEDSSLLSYTASLHIQNNRPHKPRLVELLALVVVVSQVGSTVLTPLWIDSVRQASLIRRANKSRSWIRSDSVGGEIYNNKLQRHGLLFETVVLDENTSSVIYNVTTAYKLSHHVAGFFILIFVSSVHVICFGLTLLAFLKLYPGKYITERELFYPKSEFVIVGLCSGLASLLLVYSSSGARTAPYLQAIIANFSIPITFTTRFFLLKKKPTLRKLICGIVILLAEVLSLLPTIFPQLEPHKAAVDDGGDQKGAGRVLWPLCFMASFVPTAVSRCLVESNLKGETKVYPTRVQINPIYFLFWQYLTATIFLGCVFWVDIIPGFGTSNNIIEFGKTLVFNTVCIFAGDGCTFDISIIVFLCLTFLLLQNLTIPLFLKYAEGTNYFALVSSLQTPLVLLFWTLFTESPFLWHPHLHLSTWLSLSAVCLILPAIYLYITGDPENSLSNETACASSNENTSCVGINSVHKYGAVNTS